MNKFRNWYLTYHTEITWFLVGWLALAAVHDFSQGNWGGLAIDLGLIFINLSFRTVTVAEDPETGELILPLPQDMLDMQGWADGDTLEWQDNGDGSWTLIKL